MSQAACCLLLSPSMATAGSLPGEFSATQGDNGWRYQSVGDGRSSNTTNPSTQPLTDLDSQGVINFANGSVINEGPGFFSATAGVLPYVMLDATRDLVLIHPGPADVPSIGGAASFEVPASGAYRVTGAFARANDFRLAGDGVDVVIAREGILEDLLFETEISSDHAVDADDPFQGSGVAEFDFVVDLVGGETLSFIVFNGPQGEDTGFDVMALRATIVEVPEPCSVLIVASAAALAGVSRRKLATLPRCGRSV